MSPFRIILIFFLIAALGYLLLGRLSLDLAPNEISPAITVSFDFPNTPPDVVEQNATSILENAFSQISQIKKIYSVSGFGTGEIEVTFDEHANLAFKKFEINSIIRRLYSRLPAEISYPLMDDHGLNSKDRSPLLVYEINGHISSNQIDKTIRTLLLNRISQTEGVKDVVINGTQPLQITIEFEQDKVRQLGVNLKSIPVQLAKAYGTHFPGSLVTSGHQTFTLKAGDAVNNVEEVRNTAMESAYGKHVMLRDFARVYLEPSTPKQYFRVNGVTALTISIYADDAINRIKLAADLEKLINERFKLFPPGYTLIEDYNDTDRLNSEIDKNIVRSSVSFGILFLFLLIVYRDKKYLIVLFSGIFVSLGMTALFAFLIGLQINLYSIAGITISLGIIIDNSIVVLDHIRTKGNSKITRAIIGAALTTIAALLLVFLLPREDRLNLSDFCLCITVAVSMSVLTATLFTPSMAKFLSLNNKVGKISFASIRNKALQFRLYSQGIGYVSRYKKSFVIICILFFGLPIFMLPGKWEGHEWYNNTLGHAVYQEQIRPVTDKLLGGVLRLFVRDVSEKTGYRDEEPLELVIHAELPLGNTLDHMNNVMQGVENYLAGIHGIHRFITHVQSGQYAKTTVIFNKQAEKTSLPFSIRRELIMLSNNWGGVHFTIYGIGDTFENSSAETLSTFRVELKGYNYTQLDAYSQRLKERLTKHKRVQNVNTNDVLIWNEKNFEQLELSLSGGSGNKDYDLIAGSILSKGEQNSPSAYVSLKNEQLPVYFRAAAEIPSLFSIMDAYIVESDSQTVRLSSFASLTRSRLPAAIHKEDRQYIRILSFDYTGSSHIGGEFLDETLEGLKTEMLPGYTAEPDRQMWDWEKLKRQYSLLPVLIIVIFFVGAILFENLKQPLLIITTIPLSFIGPFLAFTWFGFYFDQGGYASLILLGGLVVNASVYIINDLNNEKRYGYNRRVMKAVAGKMKPVTLTILSSCLGVIPFMMLGQKEVFWFALALGTASGLLVSLMVIFVCLPVFLTNEKRLEIPRFTA